MTEAALYVVGTPIGNLGDLSSRAVETLGQVARIYAEDTRRTRTLLRQFDIATALRSLHAHNEEARSGEVVELIRTGHGCAVVTDAGSPGISDPGARLVRRVAEAGLPVRAVPGASAVTAAAGVSGIETDRFLFLGFPPRKGRERTEWLAASRSSRETVIAFEAPSRLQTLLTDWSAAGLGGRRCSISRELTKLHEETRRGTVSSLAAYYEVNPVRGEITIVLEGAGERPRAAVDPEEVVREARRLSLEGLSSREIVETLRAMFELSRNEAYRIALRVGEEGEV